jgi:membrane-associated protease RseP (regulator of RpoE activity)
MAKWWKQVLILLAGVTMNFILSGLIFAAMFFMGTSPLHVQIREFEPQSLLSRVGAGTQLIPIYNTLEEAESAGIIEKLP